MNIIFFSILLFIFVFIILTWFSRQSSKKISKGVRSLIVILSLLVAILFAVGNKLLLSLPLFFLAISALKIKGLGALQILYLFRLLNYLRSTGRYSYFNQTNQASAQGNLSVDEAYQVLGLRKPTSKESVHKAHAALMKRIHPDLNKNQNTEYLSKIVNNAKDTILKNDFS